MLAVDVQACRVLFPLWPFRGVLTLPFTCLLLVSSFGTLFHKPEKKWFSQKSPCCFPSLHLSVLTLHKQFLYWLRTRHAGDGEQGVGHAGDIRMFPEKNITLHFYLPERLIMLELCLIVPGCPLVSGEVLYSRESE